MTTYEQFAEKATSEKVLLAWVEPLERLLLWTLHSGSVYKRLVSHYVISLKEGSTSLTEETSTTLASGEWFYDSAAGILYMRSSDDTDPNTRDVSVNYRLFYSTGPFSLPYDLSTGADVYYQPILSSASAVDKDLDPEQIGLALESDTKLTLINNNGEFDDVFDTLFFENKEVRLYSWSPEIPLSEKQLLFKGTVQDKSFSDTKVTFACKDNVFKLRRRMNLGTFSTSDGSVPDTYLGTAKRRLYGQFDNLRCTPVDAVLDGFTLTGTLSGNAGTTTITGVGTAFLDECSPDDELLINLGFDTNVLQIESVDSDTQLTLGDTLDNNIPSNTYTNKPRRPYRKKNRTWHIAGHKLRAPATTVTAVNQDNRIEVADVTDLNAGDSIDVNGEDAFIRRVVNSELILEQNLQVAPSVTDPVTKNPLTKVFLNVNEGFINRDWTVTNTTEAKLVLTNTAEFNIARTKEIAGSFTFTNGSRDVTVTSKDLQNNLQPRDWIRSKDLTHTTWYEILSVAQDSLELRIAYAGVNFTGAGQIKNPDLIDDDSLITVNCVGLESSGKFIKLPSSAVDHILRTDALVTDIDTAAFDTAEIEGPYLLSLAIPSDIGKTAPIIRDVITKINQSCFGSLVTDVNWDFKYQILTPDKPESLDPIKDDEIISFRVKSSNKIVRKVSTQYRHFVDRFTGEPTTKTTSFTNDFVDKYIEAQDEREIEIYLYEDNNAVTITERFALYNSLSQSVVSVKGKLGLALKNLNDKMYLELDRLYKRFGNRDRKKIGIINKITKSGTNVDVEFNDLGNVFNRVMSITPDAASDFTSATDSEKIKNSYVVDDDLEVPDITSDKELGTMIIG